VERLRNDVPSQQYTSEHEHGGQVGQFWYPITETRFQVGSRYDRSVSGRRRSRGCARTLDDATIGGDVRGWRRSDRSTRSALHPATERKDQFR